MPEKPRDPIRQARLRGLALAGVLGLGAAIYVTLAGGGNGGRVDGCDGAEAVAAALDPLVKGELAAFQIAREPEKLSGLAFTGAEGEAKTLGDFSGRVALVNLWATWCAPCREEMPALDRLQTEKGGTDFSVVPVSIDTTDPDRPRSFLESVGVRNLPLYTDRSTEIFQELKTRGLALGLPVTLLLDRNGCSLGHINGPAVWDSADAVGLIEAAIEKTRPQALPQSQAARGQSVWQFRKLRDRILPGFPVQSLRSS